MKGKFLLLIFSLLLSGLFYDIFADSNGSTLVKVVGDTPATFDSLRSKSQEVSVATILDELLEICDEVKDSISIDRIVLPRSNLSLSALDFIIETCGAVDYYDSGNCLSDCAVGLVYANDLPSDIYITHRPVKGIVTSKIGYRSTFHRMHRGMDFSTEIGDTIVAATGGVVNRIGYEKDGYGLFICVCSSQEVETIYAHLSKALVSRGDSIRAGAPLALAGNTGSSTGPHLHFEIRYKGKIVDPNMFFQ